MARTRESNTGGQNGMVNWERISERETWVNSEAVVMPESICGSESRNEGHFLSLSRLSLPLSLSALSPPGWVFLCCLGNRACRKRKAASKNLAELLSNFLEERAWFLEAGRERRKASIFRGSGKRTLPMQPLSAQGLSSEPVGLRVPSCSPTSSNPSPLAPGCKNTYSVIFLIYGHYIFKIDTKIPIYSQYYYIFFFPNFFLSDIFHFHLIYLLLIIFGKRIFCYWIGGRESELALSHEEKLPTRVSYQSKGQRESPAKPFMRPFGLRSPWATIGNRPPHLSPEAGFSDRRPNRTPSLVSSGHSEVVE